MKTEYLTEFLALARIGNYTAAAESLFTTESSLSRHIMSLEKDLNTTLFFRGTKKVTLTESGVMLVPYAEKVVDSLSKYESALERSRQVRQKLTVGFGHAVLQYGIVDYIYQFKADNPDIDVQLTEDKSENLWRMARSGECDFVVCYEYDFLDARELRVLPLLTDHLAIVLPDSHPLADRGTVSLGELKNEHFILQSRSSTMCKFCLRLMRENGCDTNSMTFAGTVSMDMVSRGLGIAFMEKTRYQPEAPDNVRFLDLEPPVEKRLALVYRKFASGSPSDRFLTYIRNRTAGNTR